MSRVAVVKVSPTITEDRLYVGAQEIVRPALAAAGTSPMAIVPAKANVALRHLDVIPGHRLVVILFMISSST
jgi:hypothetical protein